LRDGTLLDGGAGHRIWPFAFISRQILLNSSMVDSEAGSSRPNDFPSPKSVRASPEKSGIRSAPPSGKRMMPFPGCAIVSREDP
jgi:hypothetical protein